MSKVKTQDHKSKLKVKNVLILLLLALFIIAIWFYREFAGLELIGDNFGSSRLKDVQNHSSQFTQQQGNLPNAPEFSLEDYDGKKVSLSNFVGRPVVVNSWAVWCPFCVEELDDFAKVQREFDSQVTIIAIDRAESRQTTKEFTDELGITDDLIFLLDPSDSFYQSIGGFSMPETIFINSAGEIVFHKRGPMEENEIRQKIKEFFNL